MKTGQQLDLLDEAPAGTDVFCPRIGNALRRLVEGRVVTLSRNADGQFKITATKGGKDFLSMLRAARNITTI